MNSFFTKLTDWESEVEFRYLTRWDASAELFVDVSEALKVVLVGHAVAPIVFKFIPREAGRE
jgi:hypothetical protein